MSSQCLSIDGGVRRQRGGITVTFPAKLHALLMEIERGEAFRDVMHWSVSGSTFVIQRRKEFTDILLPEFFRARKFESFERQLRGYGFTRANLDVSDPDVYVYYHGMFHRNHPEHTRMIKRRYSLTDLSKSPCRAGLSNLAPMLIYSTKNEARALAVVSPPETPGAVATALFPDTRTPNFKVDHQSKESWLQFASCRQLLVPSLHAHPLQDIASNKGPGIQCVPVDQCTGTSQAVDDIVVAFDALCNIAPLSLQCPGISDDGSTSNAEFSSFTAFDEAAYTIPWDDEDECSLRSLAELCNMWDPEVERLSPVNVVTGAEDHEGWDK